jgi:hypothetical protein
MNWKRLEGSIFSSFDRKYCKMRDTYLISNGDKRDEGRGLLKKKLRKVFI